MLSLWPQSLSKAEEIGQRKVWSYWPVISNHANIFCAVLLCNVHCRLYYHSGERAWIYSRWPPLSNMPGKHWWMFLFHVKLLHSVDLSKTCICHVHVHSCSSQCFVLKVMSQWEWESIHTTCYQWAVLLSAGTVWLQEHFKEPVRRRSKPVRWDMRSQRAALQQLNDVEASSSVRQ